MEKIRKINELLRKQNNIHQKALKALSKNEDSVPFWHIEQSIILEIINTINISENKGKINESHLHKEK